MQIGRQTADRRLNKATSQRRTRRQVSSSKRAATSPDRKRASVFTFLTFPCFALLCLLCLSDLRRRMQQRSMSFGSKPNGSFWGNSNSSAAAAYHSSKSANAPNGDAEESASLLTQVWGLQDSMITQLQGFAGSLPEAGPLSESFRIRLTQAVYLLIGSAFFGVLTVVIGLPTIFIRPSKFVLCLTLTTALAASSVIVLQKPSVFFSKLMSGACSESLPFIILVLTELITVYVTIFIHKYIYILICASIQLLALLYYLSCFIPGGATGLQIILRMSFTIISTLAQPIIMIITQCIRSLFS